MTQAALGQALGMSQSAVSRLEKRGQASYTTDVLAAAAAHLQIRPSWWVWQTGARRRLR
jgi:transcriptional regulator with XRE-family HTH domain